MRVVVNGEEKEIKDNITLYELISDLGVLDRVMAAAVNMEIVKKESWDNYKLKDGEKIELLHFVGGGWYMKISHKLVY